jgi:hypothetical protein
MTRTGMTRPANPPQTTPQTQPTQATQPTQPTQTTQPTQPTQQPQPTRAARTTRTPRLLAMAAAGVLLAACDAREAPPAPVAAEDFAGCYALSRVGLDMDGVDRPLPPPPTETPVAFELSPHASEEMPGYFVLLVPAGADGAPVAGGAWTLAADSAVILWQGARRSYALTVAVDGDTLRGSGRLATMPHALSSSVVLIRQPCDEESMVPARSTGIPGPRPRVL